MMTQNQGAVAIINELSLSSEEFEAYLESQAIEKASQYAASMSWLLADATENILTFAKWLREQQITLSKIDFKRLVAANGWKGKLQKLYLQVASAFERFLPQDLASIEPRTIFLLAQNRKKYQPVIDQMASLMEITQEAVQNLINAQRKPRFAKIEDPSNWRMDSEGRYYQVGLIREDNHQTGTIIEEIKEEEGLTAQAVVARGAILLKALKEGRIYVKSENGEELLSMDNFSQFVEFFLSEEPVASDSDDLSQLVESVISESPSEVNDFSITTEENSDISVPEEVSQEVVNFNIENLTWVNASELTELETESQVDLLIQIFQNATSWREISNALVTYSECEQEAWDALTPLERRRVTQLTPVDIQKLSAAKKAGKIINFREVRDGVYQIKCKGFSDWQVVYSSRLDNFLSNL